MRTNQESPTFLQDHITLRELATLLRSSYFTAYSLAASGVFGELIIVGRTHLFKREVAERAVRDRLAQRALAQARPRTKRLD
jgi:hypothetical protein